MGPRVRPATAAIAVVAVAGRQIQGQAHHAGGVPGRDPTATTNRIIAVAYLAM